MRGEREEHPRAVQHTDFDKMGALAAHVDPVPHYYL
jgi:hypothetical protein